MLVTNARMVLADSLVDGALSVRDGLIAEIGEGPSAVAGALDFEGDLLLPGFVELHTDNLEKHGKRFRVTALDDFCGHAGNDRIGRHVLGDDGRRADHRAIADGDAGHDHRAMADPHIVPDGHVMIAPPLEKFRVIAQVEPDLTRAIAVVMLAGAPSGVVARIDADECRNRAELSDRGVNDRAVMDDIAVIAERGFGDAGARAHFG
jgi:hypothetical protein